MMFDGFEAVRKYFRKHRLTKVHDGHYKFKNDSGKIMHVFTIDGLIIWLGGPANALEDLQHYGYVDEQQRNNHYFAITANWHPIVMNMSGHEKDGLLAKHLQKTLEDEPYVMGYDNKLWNAFKFHMDRHLMLFAPIKPKSWSEVQK